MNRRVAIATSGIILSLLLGGFAAQPQAPTFAMFKIAQNAPDREPASAQKRLADANIAFGFKLFSALVSKKVEQNTVVSPTSIAIALSMLYNGAGSETKAEMAKALSLEGMTLEELNGANLALQQSLENADSGIQLAIANSLWIRQGLSLRHQFLKNNRQYYDAQVTNLNFASPEAVGIINRWVAEQTEDNIEEIIDRINPDDVLFLLNAVYFKGNWSEAFDKAQTQTQIFYSADGSSKQHPFMSRRDEYQYYENDRFQAIALPYGEGDLSMYVFLPRQGGNLNAFLSQLTPQNCNQWLSQFKSRQGLLKMPRFKSEYKVELKDVLATLGASSMFDGNRADFSAMTSEAVAVDRVSHRTFIQVNEEGTEAAATTGVGVQVTSAMPENQPFEMTVDRPFFFAIRDRRTGAILFMGAISQVVE